MRLGIPFIFLFLLARALPTAVSAQPADDRIVARVNDAAITVEQFNATYVQRLIQTGGNDTPAARHAHLNDLIDAYLFGEEARRRGLDDAAYDDYIDVEIKKVVGGRFFEVAFADSVKDPTDPEVRDAFRKTKEKLILRQLFFTDADAAAEAYERLQSGEDFLALANEVYNTESFDSTAGLLGEAEYWDLDDSVAVATFDLALGEYTPPIRTKFGWHILRVEDRLRNPILTESEFQRRRDDLWHRVRARRFRLEGDRFVRRFMDSLSVTVNEEAMHALRDVILAALPADDDSPTPRVSLDAEEVVAIEEHFSPESELATYVMDGETKSFRAHQYFEWLPHLPYGEVKNRTAASVGRALRNEAMAERGLSLGLQRDPDVEREVLYRSSMYLAEKLREKLRREAAANPTESELREAYERLDYRTLEKAEADYWHLQFESLAEAEEARDAITAGSSAPASFETYAAYEDRDLTEIGELGTHLQRAPLETPVVVGTGDGGWHVVEVQDRAIEYVEFEDAREEIQEKVGPYIPEIRLTRELREEADIEINHELFREMMELGGSAAS